MWKATAPVRHPVSNVGEDGMPQCDPHDANPGNGV